MYSSPTRHPHLPVCRFIHALTASGIIVGMAALVAVLDGSPRAAVLLLVVAQLIDGIDGPLARRFDIATVMPRYDGYILDLVIDYVTCVLVPAAFAWQFVVVPHDMGGKIVIALMLTTSAMWFSRTDMMTDDHWFRGFPGVWNLVVPTLWLLHANSLTVLVVLATLSLLSMTDVEFPHPVQVLRWRTANIAFTAVWLASIVALTSRDAPDLHPLTGTVLLLGPLWTIATTVVRAVETRTQPDGETRVV